MHHCVVFCKINISEKNKSVLICTCTYHAYAVVALTNTILFSHATTFLFLHESFPKLSAKYQTPIRY